MATVLLEHLAISSPRRDSREPAVFPWRRFLAAKQALGLQLPQKVRNVGNQLGSRHVKLALKSVRDLHHGMMLLQHCPDSESHRIETEANPLLEVEQDGAIFGRSLPHPCCDRDVFGA